jgi:hypothetical protein
MQDWLSGFNELNHIAEEEVKSKEYLVDMFRESLPALDMQDKLFYRCKNIDQRREIEKSMWILMRFMSSSKSIPEHHLLMVNDLVNTNFNLLVKKARDGKEGHAELQWMLLSMCGSGKKQYHERIPSPKGLRKNKLEETMLTHFPLMKDSDLEFLLKLNSRDDLEEFFKANGYADKDIKELLKVNSKEK